MSDKNYLMIDNTTNIVENVVVWDGNTDNWNPGNNYTMLVQSTTNAKIWSVNMNLTPIDYELTIVAGHGQIGFTWDGTSLTTNEPKPIYTAPVTV